MKITKPEMIIFDYGHTLLCEPDWNSDRGNVELMKYIVKIQTIARLKTFGVK